MQQERQSRKPDSQRQRRGQSQSRRDQEYRPKTTGGQGRREGEPNEERKRARSQNRERSGVRRNGREDDRANMRFDRPRQQQRNGGRREANRPAKSSVFEDKEHFRDFYGERKDESKVQPIYDVEFAREIIDFTEIESDQIAKLFQCREAQKKCHFDKSLLIRELIFKPSNFEEDLIFMDKPHIWQNLRKWVTLIDFYHPSDPSQYQYTVIGRKGLNKILPLNVEYVDRSTRANVKSEKIHSANHFTIKNLLLAGAKKSMLQGHKVEVATQIIPNGESAQISWSSDAKSWVISSRQMTILAEVRKHIDSKNSQIEKNLQTVNQIAHLWFDHLEHLELNNISLNDLKEDLYAHTLIGYVIGNDKVLKYNESVKLVFSNIVKNKSHRMALLPEQSSKVFSKFNLNMVQTKSLGFHSNFDQLCDTIYSTYHEVTIGTSASQQEGSNLLIIKRGDKTLGDRILSISKIDCFEFTILNTARSLLVDHNNDIVVKNLRDYAAQTDALKQKFIKDVRSKSQMCKDQLPHSTDVYIDMLILAFNKLNERVSKDNYDLRDLKTLLLHNLDNCFHEFVQIIQDGKAKISLKCDALFETQEYQIKFEGGIDKLNHVDSDDEDYQNGMIVSDRLEKVLGKSKKTTNDQQPKREQREEIYVPEKIEFKEETQQVHEWKMKEQDKAPASRKLSETPKHEIIQHINKLNGHKETKNELTIIYCPPFTLANKALAAVRQSLKIQIMPKLNQKSIREQTILTQNLQGAPQLCESQNIKVVLMSHDQQDQAVKNQLLYAEDYFVMGQYQDIDSIQLRQYFEDQKTIIEFLQSKNQVDIQIVRNSNQFLNHFQVSGEEAIPEVIKKSVQIDKHVTVIIPIGLPGIGKTTLHQQVLNKYFKQNKEIEYTVISKEQIRSDFAKEYSRLHPKKSEEAVYQNTKHLLKDGLEKKLQEAVASKSKEQLIFLDKNPAPAALARVSEVLDELKKKHPTTQITKVALIPHAQTPHELARTRYPFTLQLLTTSYMRVLGRKDHTLLPREDPDLVCRVLFGFFNSYRDLAFDNQFKKKFGIDQYLELDLSNQNPNIQLPPNIVKAANDCILKAAQSQATPQPAKEFDHFVKLIQTYREYFGGSGWSLDHSKASGSFEQLQSKFAHFMKSLGSVKPSQRRSDKPTSDEKRIEQKPAKVAHKVQEIVEESFVTPSPMPEPPVVKPSLRMPKKQQETPKPPSDEFDQDSFHQEADHLKKAQNQEQHEEKPSKRKAKKVKMIEEVKEEIVTQVKKFKPTKYQSDQLDFESTNGTRKKAQALVDSSSDDERVPLYLSIDLIDAKKRIQQILEECTRNLQTKLGHDTQNLQSTCKSLLNLASSGKQADGWRFTQDFHVTCLFMNRDEDIAEENEIYHNFEKDVSIDIEICALIIVPDKIVTAICFPDANEQKIENPCPHVTLAINEWEPSQSNVLLEKSCLKDTQPFTANYRNLKKGESVKEGKEILFTNNLQYKKNAPAVSAYFVTLPQPIKFEGVTKVQY